MDEPTNHLDLEMRHALTMALQAYKGAMVVVSHDRHLLRNCVSEFWLISNNTLVSFDGDLSDYQQLLSSSEKKSSVVKEEKNIKPDAKGQRQEAAALRAQLNPLRKKLEKLEKDIKLQQNALKDIEEQLADSDIYQDLNKTKLQDILKDQGNLKRKLFASEELWLECQEQLESLQMSA